MPSQQSKEQKWLRVLERAKIVAKLEAPHQQRFLALMKNMQVASREQAGGEGRPEYALEKVRLAAKRRAVRELNAQRGAVPDTSSMQHNETPDQQVSMGMMKKASSGLRKSLFSQTGAFS